MQSLEDLIREAEIAHGHLCAGQILGVRLAMLGLAKLGIDDPRGKDRKRLVTFVEIDRCATDAIAVVTGCRLGKRALKFRDWGKMAATFVDLTAKVPSDGALRSSGSKNSPTPDVILSEASSARSAGLAESKDPYSLNSTQPSQGVLSNNLDKTAEGAPIKPDFGLSGILTDHSYKAIRVAARESSKQRARELHPEIENKNQQQMRAYRELSDDDLFSTEWVKVELLPEEFPGYKSGRITCSRCGEGINFHREVLRDGQILCRSCAGENYYEAI
jgi:formylmethanofuran dehydrogenase subunit E